MSESSGEKTEQPTDKKLRDARERGQIAQSQDIHKLLVTLAGFEIIIALKYNFLDKIKSSLLVPIEFIGQPFLFALEEVVKRIFGAGMLISLIVIGAVVVARLIGGWIQFGFLVAPKALEPKIDGLNPINNVKNIFSTKKVIELFTNILKAAVLAVIFYIIINASLRDILLAGTGTLDLSMEIGADVFIFAARLSLVIFGIIAVIDFTVQKYFFIKEQKMTKDEVFREYKQQEGDPMIKGQRKQLSREINEQAKPAPVKKAEEADAVVVNPTHFAIALRYVPGETPLPEIICKGVDGRAKDIIAIAKEKQIPIVKYVWLARTLYSTGKEGSTIPRKVLQPTAAVYRAINQLDDGKDKLKINEVLEITDKNAPVSNG